jgi:S1-C subfamily serine protease
VTGPAQRRLIEGGRTKLLLGLGCLAVLALGWLVAPRERPAPVPEAVAPILESEVQRREPARVFQGVRQAGLAVIPFTVALATEPEGPRVVADFAPATRRASRTPSGFGLMVAAGREVLTHREALGGARTASVLLAGGTRLQGEVVAYEPATGLVLVRLAGPTGGEPPLATEAAVAGSAAVAVGHVDGVEIVAPVFIGAMREDGYLLTGASGAVLPGMPVADLDGLVLAVAGAGAVPVRAHAVAPALARLRRRAQGGAGLPRTIGVSLQALEGELARALGPGAAVVAEAGAGPLSPGDVLLAVAGRPVASLDHALDAIARLAPGVEVPVTVRRATRERDVTVTPRVTLDRPAATTAEAGAPDAPLAADTFPRATLQRAGLPADARVLSVAGARPRTPEEAARLAARARPPVVVRLHHRGRAFLAVLPTP